MKKRKFLLSVSSAAVILASQAALATNDSGSVEELLVNDKVGSLVMENAITSSLMMLARHSSHSSHGSHGSHSSHSSGW